MKMFSMLSMACAAMLMLSATADAGDIRFQRLGKTITRFRSDQYGNGTIYNYGSHGRIAFDDDGAGAFNRFGTSRSRARDYDYGGYEPALEFPAQPQFGVQGHNYQFNQDGSVDPYRSGIIRAPQRTPLRLGYIN